MNFHRIFGTALILISALGAPLAFSASADLPPNTALQVRMNDRLSSDTAKPGDVFHGTLAAPVVVNGKKIFDQGSEVTGQVVEDRSGRLSSTGQLTLLLTSISGGWFHSYPLSVNPILITGGSRLVANAGKTAGGLAPSAFAGGVATDGKGAAIATGAAKREAVVEPEAVLTWLTTGNPVPPRK